jgi:hypothetical protein
MIIHVPFLLLLPILLTVSLYVSFAAQGHTGSNSEGVNNDVFVGVYAANQVDSDNGVNIAMGYADVAVTPEGVYHVQTVASTLSRDVQSPGLFSYSVLVSFFYMMPLTEFLFLLYEILPMIFCTPTCMLMSCLCLCYTYYFSTYTFRKST